MNTFMEKPGKAEVKWYVVDAEGMVLGRLASQVATILRGKNKPTFTPNVDMGDYASAYRVLKRNGLIDEAEALKKAIKGGD